MNKLEIINALQRKGIMVNDLVITESQHCHVVTLNPDMDKLERIVKSEYPMAIIYKLNSENGDLIDIEVPLKSIMANEAESNDKILELFKFAGILVDSYEAYSVQDIYNITSIDLNHIHNVLDTCEIEHCYIADVSIYISKTAVDEFINSRKQQEQKQLNKKISVSEILLNRFCKQSGKKYENYSIKDIGEYEILEINFYNIQDALPIMTFFRSVPGCACTMNSRGTFIILINKESAMKLI